MREKIKRVKFSSEGYVRYKNIILRVDTIGRFSMENVMGIFYEEQPLMWELFNERIRKIILKGENEEIDFLDVGTGSGFWAIMVAKYIGGNIVAIDKIARAVEIAEQNIRTNNVKVELRHEKYNENTVPPKSTKVIYMNPPYHIYPPEIENCVPYHARGGSYGFEEFINQLTIARNHLSINGSIFFHHMCLGNDKGPESLKFIPECLGNNISIYILNVLPPISSLYFLEQVYKGKFHSFIHEVTTKYPKLYFTDGIIKWSYKNKIKVENLDNSYLKGKTWEDRINLHFEIYKHCLQKGAL